MQQINQRLLKCVLCDFSQAGDPEVPPRCPQHPDRALVAQSLLFAGPRDYLLGARLGEKYQLIRPLGQGQFGKVYYALQEGIGALTQPVAIKVLREDRVDMQALFIDEMKVISGLRSKYTVRYLDSGYDREQGLTYMVMELIDGETLATRLENEQLINGQDAVRFTTQLLIALDEAHSAGVVHRDIKPSNLMICNIDRDEQLKVLDFGVARPNAEQPREQTQGVIPGTPAYMAPELFNGYNGQVTPQMDVYSVGVVLYQCIMGHLPFNVEGEVDNLIAYYKLYHENPKPIPLPNCVPKALSKVIYRSLSLDPKKRYRSAREMLMDLAPFSALAAKVLKLDIPINPEVLAAEHHDNAPRKTMVWLLVAAILGGSLGVIAHLNSNSISDELTEEVAIDENEKKGSKKRRSVKFTGVIATP